MQLSVLCCLLFRYIVYKSSTIGRLPFCKHLNALWFPCLFSITEFEVENFKCLHARQDPKDVHHSWKKSYTFWNFPERIKYWAKCLNWFLNIGMTISTWYATYPQIMIRDSSILVKSTQKFLWTWRTLWT